MNVYEVLVDAGEDYEVWVMEAPNPSSAIRKVLARVPYGKDATWDTFDASAELLEKNMTYKEYRKNNPPDLTR